MGQKNASFATSETSSAENNVEQLNDGWMRLTTISKVGFSNFS
jgi:hypothetical protein